MGPIFCLFLLRFWVIWAILEQKWLFS